MLLPAAGPKGFGLAFMIDLMCGLLGGGASGAEVRPLYGDAGVPYDARNSSWRSTWRISAMSRSFAREPRRRLNACVTGGARPA